MFRKFFSSTQKTTNNKNNRNNNNKDFLLLTYNEGAKKFTSNDCEDIKRKIAEEKPLLIIVCTQESKASGQEHFQHILKENIKDNYKLLLKIDNSLYKGSLINPYSWGKTLMGDKNHNKVNKNVRTRIYYRYKSLYSEKNEIEYNNFTDNKYILKKNNSTKKNFIEFIQIKKSKDTDLGKITKGTWFKGANCTLLHIRNAESGDLIKLVILNTHLYFSAKKKNGKLNTGFNKRQKEFYDLIKEFKIDYLYLDLYNIFFCGDLNFRLDPSKLKETLQNNSPNNYESIIKRFNRMKNFLNKNKNENKEKILRVNELYNSILQRKYKIENNIKQNSKAFDIMKPYPDQELYYSVPLYDKFIENAKKFGIHLTCKIQESSNKSTKYCVYRSPQTKNEQNQNNNNNNNNALVSKNLIEYETPLSNVTEYVTPQPSVTDNKGMYTCVDKDLPRYPSMCDKILVANHENIIVNKEDLKVIKLRKSDHFMLALSGKFNFIIVKGININKIIKNKKELELIHSASL